MQMAARAGKNLDSSDKYKMAALMIQITYQIYVLNVKRIMSSQRKKWIEFNASTVALQFMYLYCVCNVDYGRLTDDGGGGISSRNSMLFVELAGDGVSLEKTGIKITDESGIKIEKEGCLATAELKSGLADAGGADGGKDGRTTSAGSIDSEQDSESCSRSLVINQLIGKFSNLANDYLSNQYNILQDRTCVCDNTNYRTGKDTGSRSQAQKTSQQIIYLWSVKLLYSLKRTYMFRLTFEPSSETT
ncbi:hypothetical protein G5I_13840 [Acromyrmex echinatior]|uniref:Uncharacterized protein n=1 Tax=Acromyrmex echinatior TaxID=103372 RepID=F4X640_ACREC|nr:hypothetical protein G5I_13840 [Acromyrmex echinatior]